jgi:hypothetical protein
VQEGGGVVASARFDSSGGHMSTDQMTALTLTDEELLLVQGLCRSYAVRERAAVFTSPPSSTVGEVLARQIELARHIADVIESRVVGHGLFDPR